MLFDSPVSINGVTFKNRIIRSSLGGRTCYYDGTVNNAWQRFERRFAEEDVGGIISATITVDDRRWSPIEYPKLTDERFVEPLKRGIEQVQSTKGCKYIIQLGDHGSHTQASLFSQDADSKSASSGFDLLFGYRNRSSAMTVEEIQRTVRNFVRGAQLAKKTGCDGIEITASKGYIIHQFLNPATNRRTDDYGGSVDNRFRLLGEIVREVRNEIGRSFLFGIRLSAVDFNSLPRNLRWPPVLPLRHYRMGNSSLETEVYARRLEALGVDYLHITSGFGFINPKESPGALPVEALRRVANSTRHLSAKAYIRAVLLNIIPAVLLRRVSGWGHVGTENADYAHRFKQAVSIPIIANGGFQRRSDIERALNGGQCDLVSMARPLLANPDLLTLFRHGDDEPSNPCTFCNACSILTAVDPIGCYDRSRFPSVEAMEDQILRLSGGYLDDPKRLRRTQMVVNELRSFLMEASPGGKEASETAVVFIHGNPGSSEDWAHLVKHVGQFVRAVAFDMPGFGQAGKPTTFNYTVSGYAKFIEHALRKLGIAKVHLVLHDFGGPFGLEWAAAHPEAFASVVLINAPPVRDYRWYFLAKVWRTPFAGELLNLFVPRWFFRLVVEWGNPNRLPDDFVNRMWHDFDRGTRRAVLKLYRATDARAMVSAPPSFFQKLDRPALVLWGQPDVYMPSEFGRQHHVAFPRADVIDLLDTGHWPFIGTPDRVGRIIESFLRTQLASERP